MEIPPAVCCVPPKVIAVESSPIPRNEKCSTLFCAITLGGKTTVCPEAVVVTTAPDCNTIGLFTTFASGITTCGLGSSNLLRTTNNTTATTNENMGFCETRHITKNI